MVDSPNLDGRKLAIRQDDRFKQRFNVAASRAREQMWVVSSLDPQADLQDGDLRRWLIEHALRSRGYTSSLAPGIGIGTSTVAVCKRGSKAPCFCGLPRLCTVAGWLLPN